MVNELLGAICLWEPNFWGPFVHGDQIFGDHLSMGTNLAGDHLSSGTELYGDRLSRGTNFLRTVCPGGPNCIGTICPEGPINWGPFVLGDQKWGTGSLGTKSVWDQMSCNLEKCPPLNSFTFFEKT